MRQPHRQQSFGFANTAKSETPRKKPVQASADHTEKEQLAIALINQGKLQEAEAIYKELISVGTSNHIIHANLASLCGMQGRFDECLKYLHKVLELKPESPEAHHNLGTALKEKGELDAAINAYSKALELCPNDPDTHYNLGITLKEKGDLNGAIEAYKTAIELKPKFPEALNNLGITLKEQGDVNAAIAAYKTAIKLKPKFPEALNNLGIILKEQGDLNAAVAAYNNVLQLKPNDPEAHINLGITLQEQDHLDAAIASYNNALELDPNDSVAHTNIGIALKKKGDLNAAIAYFNTALQLNPNHSVAHYNLGNALQEQGDLDAAIAAYNKSLELDPNDPDAHATLSHCLLILKDYRNGWNKYEWRHQRREPSLPHANPKCQRWEGGNQQKNQQLLLVSEQGLGDTLQFMRYATALRNEGLSVSLCAQPKLHSLIQVSDIDPSPLTPEQANLVTEGQWIPLLSVPRHLEVSASKPIITDPYIKTTNELVDKWLNLLSAERRPIIGINWQGNPSHEKTNSIGRSLPLKAFAPIPAKVNTSLLSLQKGFGSEQVETCSFKDRFVSCQDQVNEAWDFLETAAIIANCDLVITSDTSVAHLAGGMGKTTWLLLKKVPEWRWGLDGDSTFWYPSMRLFRQKQRGNWNEVMERVAEALQEHFGSN